jgi:hypothetical protein
MAFLFQGKGDVMKHNYFVRSVIHVRKKFNKVFGSQPVNNIEERQAAILAISWLGVLRNKIQHVKDSLKRKELIVEFNSCLAVVNNFFQQKERS